MSKKPKKVRRPKGEAPVPNPKAEAAALNSMGGKMPKDDSKKRREPGEKPVPNAKAEKRAEEATEGWTEGDAAYVVADKPIPSLRGLLKKGAEVHARFFRSGIHALIDMRKLGLIVPKPKEK